MFPTLLSLWDTGSIIPETVPHLFARRGGGVADAAKRDERRLRDRGLSLDRTMLRKLPKAVAERIQEVV